MKLSDMPVWGNLKKGSDPAKGERKSIPPGGHPKKTAGELAMTAQLKKYPGWVSEHAFCPGRRWRFDLANPALRLAIEIDGGDWQGHSRVWERERDYEKQDEAIARGWRVLRGSTEMALDGRLLKFVERCLK